MSAMAKDTFSGNKSYHSFPNVGVSLSFLKRMRDDPRLSQPMYRLYDPNMTESRLHSMSRKQLRDLARQLRVHSDLACDEEFSMYRDGSVTQDEWIQRISMPPYTTTHINICIIKPATKGSGLSYAQLILMEKNDPDTGQPYVSKPTDFVSHAWRYNFKDLVTSLETHARDYDAKRSEQGLSAIASERYFWNDIFVEDQNSTASRPKGYFFDSFRNAISNIGRTVIILSPLERPIPLTRSWCIWEIFSSIEASNCELLFVLHNSDRDVFSRLLESGKSGLDKIISSVLQVNSVDAEAFDEEDRATIHDIITNQLEGGFRAVDTVVCKGLREWIQDAALESSKNASSKNDEDYLSAARLLHLQGKLDDAERLYKLSFQKRRELHGLEHTETLLSMGLLASIIKMRGRLDEAEPLMRQNLELQTRLHGMDHEDTLWAANELGRLLKAQGHLEEAEIYCVQSMEGRLRLHGLNDARTLTSLNNVASLYMKQERLDEAYTLYHRALTAREAELGRDHAHTLSSMNNLALLLTKQGRLEEAEPLYKRALAGQIRTRGAHHRNTINTKGNLGMLLLKKKQIELVAQGRAMVEEVLDALRAPPHSLPDTSHFIKKFRKALKDVDLD